jgi:hypothetical protein
MLKEWVMRGSMTRLAAGCALALGLAGAAGAAGPQVPFPMLKSLCIDTSATPDAIARAARAAGFTPDPANPLRFFTGEAAKPTAIVLSNLSGRQNSATLGDFEVRGCTLIVKAATAADLSGLWGWMTFPQPPALPYTAYIITSRESIVAGDRAVPTPPREAGKDAKLTHQAMDGDNLRLISAEVLASGGVKLFYGVVRPLKAG